MEISKYSSFAKYFSSRLERNLEILKLDVKFQMQTFSGYIHSKELLSDSGNREYVDCFPATSLSCHLSMLTVSITQYFVLNTCFQRKKSTPAVNSPLYLTALLTFGIIWLRAQNIWAIVQQSGHKFRLLLIHFKSS